MDLTQPMTTQQQMAGQNPQIQQMLQALMQGQLQGQNQQNMASAQGPQQLNTALAQQSGYTDPSAMSGGLGSNMGMPSTGMDPTMQALMSPIPQTTGP